MIHQETRSKFNSAVSCGQLREKFTNFFKDSGHKLVPSSSLVPDNDPSVLLTTAGVQQFKSYFAGEKNPKADFGTTDLVSIQKCFRTTDIDEVGDTTHLTFFEMLGNFSVGGYGKERAIELAWRFIYEELGLSKEDLFVTVFEGLQNIPEDVESQEIWQRVAPGIEIKKFGRADNFWGPTGVSGPCGPSSEIHVKLPNGDTVEIWNLVFTEYMQDGQGQLTKLPVTNIDTGMGLERLAMSINHQPSVFETDLFAPIVETLRSVIAMSSSEEAISGLQDYPVPRNDAQAKERSLRILTDHGRAATFLAADGVVPSNIGQGYLMRRLLRRAILHGYQLDIGGRFMEMLVEAVINNYRDAYPYLQEKEMEIKQVINAEEEKFDRTRQKGLLEFQKILLRSSDKQSLPLRVKQSLPSAEVKIISGEDAFKLFDTFGFPLPLTKELAEQQGYQVDEVGFEEKFTQHRQVSKAGMEKKFKGGLEDHSDRVVQMHTATHLLQQALRDVLGPEIHQRGSNITSERLRFDFNYAEKLTDHQIKAVEKIINEKVKQDLEVVREFMTLSEARQSEALTLPHEDYAEEVSVYSIGPNYQLDPKSKDHRDRAGFYSREFCGGPHVSSTKGVGQFKIISQESIGQGLRRIKAVVD